MGYLKFCHCRRCRRGLHTKAGGRVMRKLVRGARRAAKQAIRQGYEPARVVAAGYFD